MQCPHCGSHAEDTDWRCPFCERRLRSLITRGLLWRVAITLSVPVLVYFLVMWAIRYLP